MEYEFCCRSLNMIMITKDNYSANISSTMNPQEAIQNEHEDILYDPI